MHLTPIIHFPHFLVFSRYCLLAFSSCHTTLTALELPEATLSSLTDLLVDFRRHTIDQLFQEATTQTRALVSLEEWKPVGNGMHTRLPELFNTIVQTTFAAVRDMRLDPGSSAVLEDGEQLLCEAMDAFTACLTRLAFEKDEQLGRPSPPQPDRRLMCVMANCLYARRVLAHQVAEQFRQLNLGAVTDLFQEALFELDDLDQRCIDELLRLKSLELTSFVSLFPGFVIFVPSFCNASFASCSYVICLLTGWLFFLLASCPKPPRKTGPCSTLHPRSWTCGRMPKICYWRWWWCMPKWRPRPGRLSIGCYRRWWSG